MNDKQIFESLNLKIEELQHEIELCKKNENTQCEIRYLISDENDKLKERIEKMKNCENCKHSARFVMGGAASCCGESKFENRCQKNKNSEWGLKND